MKMYLLVVLAVLGLAAPVNAVAVQYYIGGDFNDWNPAGNVMTDNSDGTYSVALSNIGAGKHEFKITNGSWDWRFPEFPNSWFYADASGNVTVTFNTNTVSDGWDPAGNRIGLSTDASSWNVVGIQNWDNADSAWTMTSLGNGQHMLSKVIAAGTYDYKYVVTGTWDSISWDNRSVNTTNTQLVLAADSMVNFYVDNLLGRVKAEVVPEPATMALLGLGSLFMARRKK